MQYKLVEIKDTYLRIGEKQEETVLDDQVDTHRSSSLTSK